MVETTFKVSTRVMEGDDHGPLIGLYPHQWFDNASVADRLGSSYDSIRGKVRLLEASEFKTEKRYPGFVPYWPGIKESERSSQLRFILDSDLRNARRMMLENGQGPYWQGKGLARITTLMDVAEQLGDLEARDRLLRMAERRMESWFSGESSKTYFHYDKRLGTVVGYPEEFFAVDQMNDHHFHYGYWIRAAADIALRDPAWAAKERWGGMVDLLIADIATAERGRSDFPFLRNFDPYEGHSWASGIGLGPFGNNQESSSEAVNAWAGLILWGEATGNRILRDLGIYLYTTEIESINYYWFDVHRQVFPPEYTNVETSMVFGGKYAHKTWWTEVPAEVHGINLLPLTTASTYLGLDRDFVERNLAAVKSENRIYTGRVLKLRAPQARPQDIWQDILAEYQALAEPQAALANWDRWGAVELGDTRSHALFWMLSLDQMGAPDFSVTADAPLYSVFRRPDGSRTYLAYNASASPITVHFTDGKSLDVAPGSLGQSHH
jgi:endoglucanase Acf2